MLRWILSEGHLMSVKSNKLRTLVEQFEALPLQRELKQTRIQLSTIANKVTEQTSTLRDSFEQIGMLRNLQAQPDMLRQELNKQVKSLQSATQALLAQLGSGDQSSRVGSYLDSLAKVTSAISKSISAAWTSVDNEILETTETLIELTGKYDATAQKALKRALAKYKSIGIPDGWDSLGEYREARDALLQARTSLNIPGVVGTFLREAANGTASVEALNDAEVQSFLKTHPGLLNKLTVKLN